MTGIIDKTERTTERKLKGASHAFKKDGYSGYGEYVQKQTKKADKKQAVKDKILAQKDAK